MRLTIGKKMILSFGILILLMIASATVAYVKISDMEDAADQLVDEAFPTALACKSANDAVSDSLAALRGYMILGSETQHGSAFRSAREAAWVKLNAALGKLEQQSLLAHEFGQVENLDALRSNAEKLRKAQESVEAIAHKDENIAAYQMLLSDAVPHSDEMVDRLTAMIEEEARIQASDERRALLKSLADMRGSIAMALASLRAYLMSGTPTFKAEFQQWWEVKTNAQASAAQLVEHLTPSQEQQWGPFTKADGAFAPLPARMIALRESEDWNQANYILEKDAVPAAQRVRAALERIESNVAQWVDGERASLTEASAALTTTVITATLVAIIIGTLVAVILSRRTVSAVQMLANAAREIASGNLSGNRLHLRTNDELEQLANTFNEMQASLKDLTGQTLEAAENLNATATEILASTQQQASAAKQQASSVQEITSTMQEINESGSQIGDRAKQVAAAAESTSTASEAGIRSAKDTSHTMEAIREQVEEVAENIVALSEKTQTIGEIIATVNDVAEQSNLLALNASIESVSAGEQGSRFSVVANEMKNLAEQAKGCTGQVRSILGEIQKGINTAVMLTEEAVKRVEAGKQKAVLTEDTIQRMAETTIQSVQAFEQIAGGTNQQQIGVGQVTQGMKDIRQAVEQSASGTAQLEKAAANLNAVSQQLQGTLRRFTI